MPDLNETLSESSPKWCLNDAPHSEHWAYNEFGGRDYCSGRPEPRRADLNETLAGMRRDGIDGFQAEALVSAVENVLALCDEAEKDIIYPALVDADRIREALTDALGSEPSNTGSKQ